MSSGIFVDEVLHAFLSELRDRWKAFVQSEEQVVKLSVPGEKFFVTFSALRLFHHRHNAHVHQLGEDVQNLRWTVTAAETIIRTKLLQILDHDIHVAVLSRDG